MALQVCLDSGSEVTVRRGLTLVNTTQISVFGNHQRAEWFRMKARFHDQLGAAYAASAHASLSHALQLLPSYAKGWLSWGVLLDR